MRTGRWLALNTPANVQETLNMIGLFAASGSGTPVHKSVIREPGQILEWSARPEPGQCRDLADIREAA